MNAWLVAMWAVVGLLAVRLLTGLMRAERERQWGEAMQQLEAEIAQQKAAAKAQAASTANKSAAAAKGTPAAASRKK